MRYMDGVEYVMHYTSEIDGQAYVIAIRKIGGGTVGEAYEGEWEYEVSYGAVGGLVAMSGSDLHTGTPKTHSQAAHIVADSFDLMNAGA